MSALTERVTPANRNMAATQIAPPSQAVPCHGAIPARHTPRPSVG